MSTPAPPGLQPLGRVVRAEDAGLYADAAGALANARLQAATLLESAAAQAEAARTTAAKEARTAAEAEMARMLADTALRTSRELAALRPLLAGAIADGVARILGARPAPEIAAEAAAHAVLTLRDRTGITLRVPPVHADVVASAMAAGEDVRVLADATLGADECVIETAAGFVRAGVNDQLNRLREALHAAAMEDPIPS